MSLASNDGTDARISSADLQSDSHFLQAVAQMSDNQEVIVSRPVYSESGMKLLDQGMRLSSRLYERLIQHRLSADLDDALTTQDLVDVRYLQGRVQHFLQSTALGKVLQRFMGDRHHLLLEVLAHMPWPARASFKLTVMRHQLPQLLDHSILMMMVAVCLALEEKMPRDSCAELAAAALLHDVGMLYMPRNWTDSSYKLTADERKQLAAHSITAMLVVRSAQAYSTRAEDAVLQHHERLDGSGYPRHLRGDEVTFWGRILMLAEVVSAFFTKFGDIPAQRLSLMLRMNHNRFDPSLSQHVFRLLALEAQAQGQSTHHSTAEVRNVIATLGAVFQGWSKCKHRFPERWQTMAGGRAGLYVDARMQAVEKALAESGSHPRQQADWWAMFEEDPSSMSEVVLINKEALWQVESCVQTCMRRWPQLLQPQTAFDQAMYDWLVSCRDVLAHSHGSVGATENAAVH